MSLKKGKKEDPGIYRPAGLPSVSGKAAEQILLKTTETWKTKVSKNSQNEFIKGK